MMGHRSWCSVSCICAACIALDEDVMVRRYWVAEPMFAVEDPRDDDRAVP